MKKTALEGLAAKSCQLVSEVGKWMLLEQKRVKTDQIEEKFLNGLVSYVDKEAEKMLVAGLSKLLPEAAFITEEATVEQAEKELTWVIDPLDGTTNFLHGLPHFSISVGLLEDGKPVLGVVENVPLGEHFWAFEKGGAFLNGEKIRCRETKNLASALAATGFPYHNFERVDAYFSTLDAFMKKCRGVRRFGSAALDLAWVAAGRFDFFYEHGLNAWDVAGGAVLVAEAGGRITDYSGGSDFIFGNEILAGGAGIFDAAFEIVEKEFR